MGKKPNNKKEKKGALANPLNYAPKYKVYDKDAEENKIVCCKGYIPFLFWWPLVRRPNSKFGRKCANQGLILTLLTCIFALICLILSFTWVGKIGEYDYWQLVGMVFAIIIIAFTVSGLLSTSEGDFIRVPIFGKITIIKETKKKK